LLRGSQQHRAGRLLHREHCGLLLGLPQEMAQLAAGEGGLDGAQERAHARRGGVGRRDGSLDQERPPFFVRTLPDPPGRSQRCGPECPTHSPLPPAAQDGHSPPRGAWRRLAIRPAVSPVGRGPHAITMAQGIRPWPPVSVMLHPPDGGRLGRRGYPGAPAPWGPNTLVPPPERGGVPEEEGVSQWHCPDAQFIAVCRRSERMAMAREGLEESRVFAGNEPCNGEEIRYASARFYTLQSVIN